MDDNQRSLPGMPKRKPREEGDFYRSEPGVEARLKGVDWKQLLLRAIDVERLIEEEHPARAVWEFVGRLDHT